MSYQPVVIRRGAPTRLAIMRSMLSAQHVISVEPVASLILVYLLDEVGLIVEWFDALRSGDVKTVQWFYKNTLVYNNGMTDIEYETKILVQITEILVQNRGCSGPYLDTLKWRAIRDFIRDKVIICSGTAHVVSTMNQNVYALAAAPTLSINLIIAVTKGLPFKQYLEVYRIKTDDQQLYLRLQEEFPDIAAKIPTMYEVKCGDPSYENSSIDMLISDSTPIEYGSLRYDNINLRCELARQATLEQRIALLEDLSIRNDMSLWTNWGLSKKAMKWHDGRHAKPNPVTTINGMLDQFSFSYHFNMDCQSLVQAGKWLRGIIHKSANMGIEKLKQKEKRKIIKSRPVKPQIRGVKGSRDAKRQARLRANIAKRSNAKQNTN